VIPAAVTATYRASGRDLYGSQSVERAIVEIRGDVEPGDSGGPLVLEDGSVGGVIFAESRTDATVGYALAVDAVSATVLPAVGRSGAVPTGPCVR
jgi:S1-C subfamily serine protease